MHPEVHALQNVPAAVVDDAADLGGVEGAGEVGVHVVVVVQAATAKQMGEIRHKSRQKEISFLINIIHVHTCDLRRRSAARRRGRGPG